MMNKVYVVQEPPRFKTPSGDIAYRIDLSPAALYGDLVFVLEHGELKDHNWDKNLELIAKRLENFNKDDYLVMLGNPVAMAIASLVAATRVEKLKVLYWVRTAQDYTEVVFNIYDYIRTGELK